MKIAKCQDTRITSEWPTDTHLEAWRQHLEHRQLIVVPEVKMCCLDLTSRLKKNQSTFQKILILMDVPIDLERLLETLSATTMDKQHPTKSDKSTKCSVLRGHQRWASILADTLAPVPWPIITRIVSISSKCNLKTNRNCLKWLSSKTQKLELIPITTIMRKASSIRDQKRQQQPRWNESLIRKNKVDVIKQVSARS